MRFSSSSPEQTSTSSSKRECEGDEEVFVKKIKTEEVNVDDIK